MPNEEIVQLVITATNVGFKVAVMTRTETIAIYYTGNIRGLERLMQDYAPKLVKP